MRSILKGAVIVLTSWVVSAGWATDRYVAINNSSPAAPYTDWTTAATNIQTAINAASAGDTVWVGPGRYTVWTNSLIWNSSTNVIYFYNKSLAVRSSAGPATTIIDGEGLYRGVLMGAGAANQEYLLDGFTITNCVVQAYGSGGGGVVIYSPGGTMGSTNTVQNCIVTDCQSTDYRYNCAGGIFVSWVYNPNQPLGVIVSNCVIRNCSTNGFCQTGYSTNADARTIIVDCTVVNNRGSGLWMTGGNFPEYAMIKNCLITDNTTPGSGGGIYIGRPVDIYNCVVARNGAYSIYTNNETWYSGGGGVYIDQASSTATFYNCTIVSNWVGGRGIAGVMAHSNASPEWVYFYNTIVYSNWNAWYGQNNIGGAAVKYYINSMTPGVTGAGNISTPAPVFENIAGGDYRLTRFSSGVDAGVVQDWMTGAKDAGGQPRVSGNGLVDMGAYETEVGAHPGYYVAKDGQTPMYPYTNWTMAASNIQDAIDAYVPGYPTTMWVGPGRYTAGVNAVVRYGTNSVVDFYNKPLALRGFSGNPDDTLIDGEGKYRCVLMGPAAGNGTNFPFTLDGFTLTNGFAPGNNSGSGGLYIYNAGQTFTSIVQNCVITDNRTTDGDGDGNNFGQAGGIYLAFVVNYNQDLAMLVSNCVIRNNSTNGMCYNGYSTNAHASFTVVDSRFENNIGSGLLLSGGTHWNTIRNSRFTGNATYNYGGGAYLGIPVDVVNCLFASNRCLLAGATTGGGALYLSCPTNNARWPWKQGCNLVNCTIVDNYTTNTGVAVYQYWADANCATLINTIIWSNRNMNGVANYSFDTGSGADVFWTNCLSTALTGAGNLTKPPAFENQAAGDYHLKRYSAGVDGGVSNLWIEGTTDLAGQPRISDNGLVDMGVYETSYEPHPGHFVALSGQTPQAPYTNLAMAASNIQDAVNVVDGNYQGTVWVAPGRYTLPPNAVNYGGSNVVYIDRPAVVRSLSGNPGDTTIDGEGTNRGIAIVYGTGGQEIVIDGFTISNCHAVTMGAGIMLIDPVNGYSYVAWTGRVQNCRILGNTVNYGPALGYQAVGAYGGGIGMHCRDASALILSNCVLQSNVSTNEMAAESAGGVGGGVYFGSYYGGMSAVNSLLQTNRAYQGGNAHMVGGGARFENCDISAGRVGSGSQSFGGGVFLNSIASFRNCRLTDNNTGINGRGAAINQDGRGSNSVVEVSSCTIAGNAGNGIYIRGWAEAQSGPMSLHLWNSVVYSNAGDLGIAVSWLPDSYSSYASNSCLGSTNAAGVMYGTTNLLYYAGRSSGNTTNNPRFVNYAGGDYRVAFNSPCINAGFNEPWMTGALDLAGNPRISPIKNGTVDMGAYEFPIQVGSVFILR